MDHNLKSFQRSGLSLSIVLIYDIYAINQNIWVFTGCTHYFVRKGNTVGYRWSASPTAHFVAKEARCIA